MLGRMWVTIHHGVTEIRSGKCHWKRARPVCTMEGRVSRWVWQRDVDWALKSPIQEPHQPRKRHGINGERHTRHNSAWACNKIKVSKKKVFKLWGSNLKMRKSLCFFFFKKNKSKKLPHPTCMTTIQNDRFFLWEIMCQYCFYFILQINY